MSYPIFFVSAKRVWHPRQHKRIEPTIPTKSGVRMANSRSTSIFILLNKSYQPLTVSAHLFLGQIGRDWPSALVCDSYSIIWVPFLSAFQDLTRRASEPTRQQVKSGISHHSGLSCQTKYASRIARGLWSRVGIAMPHQWNSRRLGNQRSGGMCFPTVAGLSDDESRTSSWLHRAWLVLLARHPWVKAACKFNWKYKSADTSLDITKDGSFATTVSVATALV